MDDRPDNSRRGSSTSTIKSMSGAESRENTYPRIDEGYASLSGTSIGSNKLVLQLSQQEPLFSWSRSELAQGCLNLRASSAAVSKDIFRIHLTLAGSLL